MFPLIPFANVTRRTAWVRATLLLATLLGLIASTPAWLNSHTFPLLPIFSSFPILPAPWDKLLFGLMLASLVAAIWFYRAGVLCFLALSLFTYCEDQNRGQPWFYMYWAMLLLTLLPAPSNLAACRWALSVVYFWSGIQKCNPLFFQKTPAWLISPAAKWHLPEFALDLLRWATASAPFLEIAVAIGLWYSITRLPSIITIAVMHLFALLFLGPLGHNYNWVVWPWNIAMIALAVALFPTSVRAKHAPTLGKETWLALRPSRVALAVLIPYTLLPILSFTGRWDSAFSFALYSESNATANVFVSQRFNDTLPPQLRAYLVPFPQYDPQFQGPFIFNFAAWGYEELHIPPVAEPRNFLSVYNALRAYAPEPPDLRMIVGDRAKHVTFYEGDISWPLQAK